MLEHLSPREREVAEQIAVKCLTSKEAAAVLGISFRTVEVHRARILEKMGARNIAQLARKLAKFH
jgi:FixJ family two-component response regulator